MKKWGHDELLRDLADHLGAPDRMLWMDMQLGPSGSPRPDVFTLQKSYTKPKPMAYEIKVSVSDFRSDVTAGKWHSYLDYAAGVYFCVPQGMVSKADIPTGAGLMVRGENGWRAVKKPTLQRVTLGFKVMHKLLIDGIERERQMRALEYHRSRIDWRRIADDVGKDVAAAARDLDAARMMVAYHNEDSVRIQEAAKAGAERIRDMAKKEADALRTEASDLVSELREILGLQPEASLFEVRQEFRRTMRLVECNPALTDARRAIDGLQRSLDRAMRALSVTSQ